jgi:hypothetical protein
MSAHNLRFFLTSQCHLFAVPSLGNALHNVFPEFFVVSANPNVRCLPYCGTPFLTDPLWGDIYIIIYLSYFICGLTTFIYQGLLNNKTWLIRKYGLVRRANAPFRNIINYLGTLLLHTVFHIDLRTIFFRWRNPHQNKKHVPFMCRVMPNV